MLFDRPRCPEYESRLVVSVPGTTISADEYEYTAVYGDDTAAKVDTETEAVDYYDFYQCISCFTGFNVHDEPSTE